MSIPEHILPFGTGEAAPDPIVKYRGIRKSYGNLEVLKGIDLDLYPGEKVAVIGPSGSGKTTLARILMTLEHPTEGTIEVEGRHLWHRQVRGRLVRADEKHLHQVRSSIGMVFQHFHLFPHMTILRNVMEAPVHVLKMPKEQAAAEALELLDKVGLKDKADAYPGRLSGGQKQRAAIARALVMKPKVMLFDEVTSALDPELTGEVLLVMEKLAQGGMTMILVTHEMNFARNVANTTVFMHQGKIWEQGPSKELFANPQTPELRGFVSAGAH